MWWIMTVAVSIVLIYFAPSVPMSTIELVGLVTALVCVWEAARNHKRNWPIGVISCVAFFLVFAQSKLWGNMALQIIYIGQAIWGAYLWEHGGLHNSTLKINGLPQLSVVQWVLLLSAVTLFVTTVLSRIGGVLPFWDTTTTVLSIVANQMLVRRRIENWYLWFVVDFISICLFASQGLWITTITYVVYIALSIKAILHWRQEAVAL